MRFDDFLAQAHCWPVPWAWGVEITITEEGKPPWSTIWRHTICSTKAEADQLRRETNAAGWLREDARLRTVKVYFQYGKEPPSR